MKPSALMAIPKKQLKNHRATSAAGEQPVAVVQRRYRRFAGSPKTDAFDKTVFCWSSFICEFPAHGDRHIRSKLKKNPAFVCAAPMRRDLG
jgi:hypothetical protein